MRVQHKSIIVTAAGNGLGEGICKPLAAGGGKGIGAFSSPAPRGQAPGTPRLHTGIGRAAAFVDAHLAAADDAVHMGFGHPL